jgi:hypothetical protein
MTYYLNVSERNQQGELKMRQRSKNFIGTCLRASCPRGILLAMYESEAGGFFHIEQDGIRVASSEDYYICFEEFDALVDKIQFPNSY